MKSVCVLFNVPLAVAAKFGVTEYGEGSWEVTPDQWSGLDEAERCWFAAHASETFELEEAPSTWERILVAARKVRATEAEAAATAKRETDTVVEAWLALSDDAIMDRDETNTVGEGVHLHIPRTAGRKGHDLSSDPRVHERLQRLKPLVSQMRAEWKARDQARKDDDARRTREKNEAEAAARKAIELSARTAFSDYCIARGGNLKRVALEGYDIRKAVHDDVCEQFLPLGGKVVSSPPAGGWAAWAVPAPQDFELLDKVRATLATVTWPRTMQVRCKGIFGYSWTMFSIGGLSATVVIEIESPITSAVAIVVTAARQTEICTP